MPCAERSCRTCPQACAPRAAALMSVSWSACPLRPGLVRQAGPFRPCGPRCPDLNAMPVAQLGDETADHRGPVDGPAGQRAQRRGLPGPDRAHHLPVDLGVLAQRVQVFPSRSACCPRSCCGSWSRDVAARDLATRLMVMYVGRDTKSRPALSHSLRWFLVGTLPVLAKTRSRDLGLNSALAARPKKGREGLASVRVLR